MVTNEQQRRKFFERNKKLVNRFTRDFLAKKKVGIVHGTRATNAQLPRKLNKETVDWDVFVKNPRLRALQLENKLDRRFKGDFFRTKKGTGSPGVNVYKILSNTNDEGFVDFANPNRIVPTVTKRGVMFATLKDQKKAAQRNIKNPKTKFRRKKDQDLLIRIKKFEKIRGKKI